MCFVIFEGYFKYTFQKQGGTERKSPNSMDPGSSLVLDGGDGQTRRTSREEILANQNPTLNQENIHSLALRHPDNEDIESDTQGSFGKIYVFLFYCLATRRIYIDGE